ncbi:MAG: TlpA disulfide reductase family protein [Verrucomicrobiota bacterium]
MEKGEPLPHLDAFGLVGDLPELEGKIVYLDFWASWCAPCKASFPDMQEVYEKYKDRGVIVVAVGVDDSEKAMNRFLSRMNATFPTVWDREQKLVDRAKVDVMPTSFLIGRDGVIVSRHRGWLGDRSKKKLIGEIEALLKDEV